MAGDMITRSTSDATSVSSPTSKRWRFSSFSRGMRRPKDMKNWGIKPETDTSEPSLHLRPTDTNSTNAAHETSESNQRQLQSLVQRMRAAPAGPSHVDSAYKEFTKVRERCSELCTAILREEIRSLPTATPSVTGALARRDSSFDSPRSHQGPFDQRSSFSGRSLAEVITGSGARSMHVGEPYLTSIRDWKNCLETLADAFKVSLADTYRSYEREATQEMVDLLFSNKKFRKEAVNRMRNASVTRVLSADPQFFPRYEIRFRNYERVKQELIDIRHLLQAGESGISPARHIEEIAIAQRGDAILEFANILPECSATETVYRFRVSSYMLAETSPIFARMFSGHSVSLQLHENEDITPHLPPPSVRYICKDGSEARLYRMPQHEVNRLGSLELLLHAAHMHNDVIPREIEFDRFVALAECCIKYKSTSPLEVVVEHRWLPQWINRAVDEMPDGLLVISYAFGLRQLFTRMSKHAVLNLVEEADLNNKPWSPALKAKIWAVRCAKVAQVHACCSAAIQDYLRQPTSSPADLAAPVTPFEQRSQPHSAATPLLPAVSPTSSPRCPKGSHACDAANLGWMMLMFNELNLLSCIMRPDSLPPETRKQSRSLTQLVDGLRRVPGPPTPVHRGGVCDPSMAFRAAVNDIYNSITGLTLYDVSGKSHGWALSKHAMTEPQTVLMEGLNRMNPNNLTYTVANEFPELVRLQILAEFADLNDLHAAAMISRAFYDTYKRHELYLIRNILRADRARSGAVRPALPLSISNAEEKVLKKESDELKENGVGEGADVLTLVEDDEDAESTDVEDSDADETPAPSIYGMDDRAAGSLRIDGGRSRGPVRSHLDGPASPLSQHNGSMGVPRLDEASFTSQQNLRTPTELRETWDSAVESPHSDIYDDAEVPMTDEEARRILWPDAAVEEAAIPIVVRPPPGLEGSREKFRAGDIPLSHEPEEKSLVFDTAKQLRSDREWRVGLLKNDSKATATTASRNSGKPDPGCSSSKGN
ncbi:hypothetical protein HJFPF1_05592 [Paramyrothecium foliicola]|nr:hypothetical protein HJFPF1_05592 [Paramyrothecium foliicola]